MQSGVSGAGGALAQCGTTTCRRRGGTRRAAPPSGPCWSRPRSCAPTWRATNDARNQVVDSGSVDRPGWWCTVRWNLQMNSPGGVLGVLKAVQDMRPLIRRQICCHRVASSCVRSSKRQYLLISGCTLRSAIKCGCVISSDAVRRLLVSAGVGPAHNRPLNCSKLRSTCNNLLAVRVVHGSKMPSYVIAPCISAIGKRQTCRKSILCCWRQSGL